MKMPGFTAENSLYQSNSHYLTLGISSYSENSVQLAWHCDSKCKFYQPDCYAWKAIWCTPLGKFSRCMGFPNVAEASACLGAVVACSATGNPVPYGICVGTACGGAAGEHTYRCAKESGII